MTDAPEPRENPLLVGQGAAEATLLGAISAGRLHHAWLLTGPQGVGKATLAYRFARHLLAGRDVPPEHPVFRRVAAGSHADLHTLERTVDSRSKKLRGEIVVDDVRAAGDFLRRTAAEGGWRVVVVDRADELNRNAANALLKILEEPPPNAMLLLVCNAPGRLPPTVRSRCRRLPLAALSEAEMATVLAAYLPDMPIGERSQLAVLSGGSPGRALMLAGEDGLAVASLVDGVLRGLPRLRPEKPYEVADAIGRTDGAFGIFMDMLCARISDAVRAALRGRATGEAARLAALRPSAEWAIVTSSLARLQDDTQRFNLDTREAIAQGIGLLTSASPSWPPSGSFSSIFRGRG